MQTWLVLAAMVLKQATFNISQTSPGIDAFASSVMMCTTLAASLGPTDRNTSSQRIGGGPSTGCKAQLSANRQYTASPADSRASTEQVYLTCT